MKTSINLHIINKRKIFDNIKILYFEIDATFYPKNSKLEFKRKKEHS